MSNIRTQSDIDTNPYVCEICNASMEKIDHDYSDICGECRDEYEYE